jgi:hypothetical protein
VGTQPGAAELADVADGTGQTTREQVGTQEVASTEGEAESEEAAADEEKSEEESAAADEGATQVADASGVESESSGSPPADASVGGAAPATLAPVPFLIGPGASATLPEPLNASSLVGAGPVTESRGRLRIRIF